MVIDKSINNKCYKRNIYDLQKKYLNNKIKSQISRIFFDAKQVFIELKYIFIKILIYCYFN